MTGLKTKPHSYAKAVAKLQNEEPDQEDNESVEQQLIKFLQSNHVQVNEQDIEACHPLPQSYQQKRGQDSTHYSEIHQQVKVKSKTSLLKQGKVLKGTNVYLNEHLTKTNAELARRARQLRRENKIKGMWTRNCKVYILTNGSPETAKVMLVRSLEDLGKF